MRTKRVGPRSVALSLLVMSAVVLGGAFAPARAATPDATSSPAGPVTGVIVVFSPTFGAPPAGTLTPSALTGARGLLPTTVLTPTAAGPTLPAILLLAPTSTGSLVVPVQVPAISGAGPAFTQLQLVIPGPNPAQNTPIAVAQLLEIALRSPQVVAPRGTATPASPVSVFVTSAP